jgi:nicotinate-nucleotide adenylyltransferase
LKRYGIFGGVFDPIHLAHLIMAEDVRQQVNLDKVIFIPSGTPPLKNSGNILDAETRLHLVNLAIRGNPFFESSDIEINDVNPEKSFTVNTLIKLREKYQAEQVKLYLIIGMDNLVEMEKWKEPGKVFLLSQVVVINRPGYVISDVKNDYGNQVTYIPAPNIDISSTDIRHRIQENKSIKYLVPSDVEKYIIENNLYK